MTTVECGIKAFDIHELLCHLVAKRLGYYDDEGLQVRVVDVTFTPDDKLPEANYFQVACGAAYLGRREGHPFKVVLAAVDRPMFWLHARPEIQTIEQLAGTRVATFAAVAPPHYFHRVLLRAHGLDADRDLSFRPARDDIIRLALLREGDVDAALVSSAISPVTVQRLGLRTLAHVGDEVRFVTTGVATTERVLQTQPELIQAVIRAFRRSLDAIHNARAETVAIVADALRESEEVADRTYELVRGSYTADGKVATDVLEDALRRVGAEVKTGQDVDVAALYDFSMTLP